MMTIRAWEVWLANVRFEDQPTIKRRPVVITSAGTVFVLGLKVTSHAPRNEWGEYELLEWKYAGLQKPSTVRISKQLRLRHTDMVHRLGALHQIDIINIQNIIAELH